MHIHHTVAEGGASCEGRCPRTKRQNSSELLDGPLQAGEVGTLSSESGSQTEYCQPNLALALAPHFPSWFWGAPPSPWVGQWSDPCVYQPASEGAFLGFLWLSSLKKLWFSSELHRCFSYGSFSVALDRGSLLCLLRSSVVSAVNLPSWKPKKLKRTHSPPNGINLVNAFTSLLTSY